MENWFNPTITAQVITVIDKRIFLFVYTYAIKMNVLLSGNLLRNKA